LPSTVCHPRLTKLAHHYYGQLLTHGQVIHFLEDVDDIDAWRAAISGLHAAAFR
jgi:hypothetical protein